MIAIKQCSTCDQPVDPTYRYCPMCGVSLLKERSDLTWKHIEQHDRSCETCRDALALERYPNFGDRCSAGTRLEALAFALDRAIGVPA